MTKTREQIENELDILKKRVDGWGICGYAIENKDDIIAVLKNENDKKMFIKIVDSFEKITDAAAEKSFLKERLKQKMQSKMEWLGKLFRKKK
jgi:hypothetical protein